MEIQVQREWEGDVFFTHGTNSARVAAILFSSRREYNVIQTRRDDEGRILNILLKMEENKINILNAYAPYSDTERRTFFSDMEQILSQDHDNIIGGHFNCIMDVRQDILGGNIGARQSASTFLRTLNARYNLIHVWRDCHQGQHNYTWSGRNPTDNSLIRTCIDFFLVGRAFKLFITSTDIRPYVHSDDDCISLTLDLEKVKRGPGYWHLNNELLTDAVFQAEIEEFWADWKQKFQEFPDPLQWWDKAKQNFKSIAIRRAKIRPKVQCHQRFQLESKLRRMRS